MPVTIRDVAVKAGVSHATVSFVLNGKQTNRIAPATQTLVRQIAKELGYQPNHSALSMSRGRTSILGIIFAGGVRKPWRVSGWYGAMLDSVTDAVNTHSHNLLLYTDQDYSEPTANTASLTDHRCDGLLLFGFQSSNPLIDTLIAAQMPFVLVNNTVSAPLASSVDIDNRSAGRDLAEYLLTMGHRRIAFLGLTPRHYWCDLRLEGCREALDTAGVALREEDILLDAWKMHGLNTAAIRELVQRPQEIRPTALLCTSDEMALRIMEVLTEIGLRVPEDISLVGFNDVPEAKIAQPPLTTIRLPLGQIGQRSVEILIDLVSGALQPGYREELPSHLVIRSSVARLEPHDSQ